MIAVSGTLGAHDPAYVVAVHLGKIAVQHEHVIANDARLHERVGAVSGQVDGHALTPESAGDRVRQPALIFDDQYAHL